MADDVNKINDATDKILENVANPVQSYEVDGEKVTRKDPLRQLQALEEVRRIKTARKPLSAVRFFRITGGRGDR